MTEPYYSDEHVQLFVGDWRELIPSNFRADLILTDPPYGETSLAWDRWPTGWPELAARHADAMWCFGSMRMFLDRRDEFAAWKLSQDVVWEKHTGTGIAADRFRRVHEHALHWYQGDWGSVVHDTPRVARSGPRVARAVREPHKTPKWYGSTGASAWEDDGSRLAPSILKARTMHRMGAINETEKPVQLLEPLLTYGCPPGGTVLDLFAGSCSTGVAAKHAGRKAVLYELREEQAELAARRLSQDVLDFGGGVA